MNLKALFLGVAVLLLFIQPLKSQDDITPAYGFYGSFNMNDHSYELRQLPEVVDTVPRYATGKTNGFTLGALYELPLSRKVSSIFRAGYTNNQPQINGDVPVSDTILDHHRINANLSSVDLEAQLRYRFLLNFSFLLGGSVSVMLDNSYTHELIRDNRLTKVQYRDFQSLNSSQTAYKIALSTGLSYEIPIWLDRKMLLVPEIIYNFGYVSIDKNMHWDVNTLRLGVEIKYAPSKPQLLPPPEKKEPLVEKKPEVVVKQEVPIAKKETKAELKVVGVDGNSEFEAPELRIEEFISTNIPPLLNYIFFDYDSSAIPTRYKLLNAKDAETFRINDLHNLPTLDVYYNILNIIGRRMHEFPKSNLTLTGCNSDTLLEKGNNALSTSRARAVYDYLTKVWKISPDRITMKTRNLPEKFSNPVTPDGTEENRRVEITSDTWDVMAPVITNSTLLVAKPEILRFYADVNTDKEIGSYKLLIKQGKSTLRTFTGKGNTMSKVFQWNINKENNTIPTSKEPVTYSLEVYDRSKEIIASAQGKIDVKQVTVREKHLNKTGDKKIDNYSLILFDFDKYALNDANKKVVKFINDRLEPNSELFISGYTDRTGEESYNMELSKSRAKSAEGVLDGKIVDVNGYGESNLLYNNDLPEGRFYCRTVEIRVETPVN